jgi:poly-gamma-glutamate synthase PgsB/CapB
MSLILLLVLVACGGAYLILERTRLDSRRRAIPLTIAVSGTRGKSSVTRMLAAVLRESGRRVLAKTTGSEAVLILPDGSEREIRRRGRPSIIEQKHVIRLAADLSVDVAVIEIMSIHPENHEVETHRLLKPDVVLVTNFRVDHTAAMGETRETVAAVLGLDVPRRARAFVPQSECLPAFRTAVTEKGAELIEVPARTASAVLGRDPDAGIDPFIENLDLVCAAARSFDVDDRAIREGIRRGRGDIGSLRIWRYRWGDLHPACFLVNAFAANDPESTMLVHARVMTVLSKDSERCIGLLNLRPDRGDRTTQWVEALRGGFLDRFSRLYVTGLHAHALQRRLKRCDSAARVEVIRPSGPGRIMQRVFSGLDEGGHVIFGFGNIGGVGEALVMHWHGAGEPWSTES